MKNGSTGEVFERWHQVFNGTLLTQNYSNKKLPDKLQLELETPLGKALIKENSYSIVEINNEA